MATALERRSGRTFQEHKRKPPTVGERLLSFKRGAYWTVEELTAIAGDRSQTQEMISRASIALDDVRIRGDDSLTHLCLEGYAYNSLRRSNIETISVLEAALKNGRLGGIIGVVGRQVISDRLVLFHQKVAKEKPTPSVQPPTSPAFS